MVKIKCYCVLCEEVSCGRWYMSRYALLDQHVDGTLHPLINSRRKEGRNTLTFWLREVISCMCRSTTDADCLLTNVEPEVCSIAPSSLRIILFLIKLCDQRFESQKSIFLSFRLWDYPEVPTHSPLVLWWLLVRSCYAVCSSHFSHVNKLLWMDDGA